MSALMRPANSVLCKLGSIAIHAQEMLGPRGHEFDKAALESLLADPEVGAWLREMDAQALIPRKR
jgi:hypothetical protein